MSKSDSFLESKGFKDFMAKLYGLGAAVVIVGALFKIMHWPGAGPMLVVGLGVEAVIFAFSAFQPVHEDPDWSLVYPELAGHDESLLEEAEEIMHELEEAEKDEGEGDESEEEVPEEEEETGITSKLDKMLEEAEIDAELIESLGAGMKNLSENVGSMKDITDVSVNAGELSDELKSASGSASKFSSALDSDVEAGEKFVNSLDNAAKSVDDITNTYENISFTLNSTLGATEKFVSNMDDAANAANNMIIQYTSSADKIQESAGAFDQVSSNANLFLEKLDKISENMGFLNEMYVKQLENAENYNKYQSTLNESVGKLQENIFSSIDDTVQYKNQISDFNENLGKLNKVYSGMLGAMTGGMGAKKKSEDEDES